MNDSPAPRPGTSEWYRAQARRFTNLAATAVVPGIKTQLMSIVREYEELARKVEQSKEPDKSE
jgi:hypothetical protein